MNKFAILYVICYIIRNISFFFILLNLFNLYQFNIFFIHWIDEIVVAILNLVNVTINAIGYIYTTTLNLFDNVILPYWNMKRLSSAQNDIHSKNKWQSYTNNL